MNAEQILTDRTLGTTIEAVFWGGEYTATIILSNGQVIRTTGVLWVETY